jgi:hypothetical protein
MVTIFRENFSNSRNLAFLFEEQNRNYDQYYAYNSIYCSYNIAYKINVILVGLYHMISISLYLVFIIIFKVYFYL